MSGHRKWEEIRHKGTPEEEARREQERKAIDVTEENFGDLLIQGAREALAYVRGKTTKARVRLRPRAARTAAIPEVRGDAESGT
jgi:hypothetical protein